MAPEDQQSRPPEATSADPGSDGVSDETGRLNIAMERATLERVVARVRELMAEESVNEDKSWPGDRVFKGPGPDRRHPTRHRASP